MDSEVDTVEDLSGDGGVTKRVTRPGSGSEAPPQKAKCKVHFSAKRADGTTVDSSAERNESAAPFGFTLGQGHLIKGVELAVGTMRRGEVAEIVCRHDYAYGDKGAPPEIPARATLTYEVELCVWREDYAPNPKGMDAAQRLAATLRMKARANDFFQAGEWPEAQEDYADAARVLKSGDMPTERRREAWDLMFTCWLNEAQCWLKLEQWRRAEASCTELLKRKGARDAHTVKALYRRATARMHLDELQPAKADLQQARKLDPNSREVLAALRACIGVEQQEKQATKAYARKMFAGAEAGRSGCSGSGAGGAGGAAAGVAGGGEQDSSSGDPAVENWCDADLAPDEDTAGDEEGVAVTPARLRPPWHLTMLVFVQTWATDIVVVVIAAAVGATLAFFAARAVGPGDQHVAASEQMSTDHGSV